MSTPVFSPRKVSWLVESTARNSLFRLGGEVAPPEYWEEGFDAYMDKVESGAISEKPDESPEIYATSMYWYMRKVDGKNRSPILIGSDMTQWHEMLGYLSKGYAISSLMFILTAIAVVIFKGAPLDESGIKFVGVGYAVIFILILVAAGHNFLMYVATASSHADALWERGVSIELPQNVRSKTFVRNLKSAKGFVTASVIDEGVSIIDSDELDALHTAASLGQDIQSQRT